MSDERELHLPDAIAHSVVPPVEPPAEAAAPPPQPPAPEDLPPASDALSVESGPMIDVMEQAFPLIWLAMLTIVSVIGIYNAVSRLP
jgi:hypothetical protein